MKKKMDFSSQMKRLQDPETGEIDSLHADLHVYYWRGWKRTLKAYLEDPRDPYNAICFLEMHPANQRLRWGFPEGWFHENLWWFYVKVDPHTKRIESRKDKKFRPDKERNTLTQVWVEWGPYIENSDDPNIGPQGIGSHDYRVDTGGATFEEAMVNLAHNIWMLYRSETDVPIGAKLKKKDRW